MYKIENNTLTSKLISFDLPQGFYIDLSDNSAYGGRLVKFVSCEYKHNVEQIAIEVEEVDGYNSCGSEYLKDILDETYDEGYYEFIGDFVNVTRGKGKAVGAYYREIENYTHGYYEVRDMKDGKLLICVYVWNNKGPVKTEISKAMQIPAVKQFLESIKYL